jgi:hypothetical protein
MKPEIMGIEEGEEEQAKGIHNTFNRIIKESFAHSGHQTDLTKIEPPQNILSLKQQAQRIKKEY